MVDIDWSELSSLQQKINRLEENLEENTKEAVEKSIDALISEIQSKIVEEGLVDTGELLMSWEENRDGSSSWTVYSTAEHSMVQEEGSTGPYEITSDDAQVLAFEPENPADYGDLFDPDSGLVFLDSVNHPGVEGSHYVLQAQMEWHEISRIEVERSVERAIIESGFNPSR